MTPPPPHKNHSKPSSTSSSSQACAACKYQRRRCTPDCTLAPYFPADRQSYFLAAHRLFGVSNILKIVRSLDPHSRDIAMHSIIFQSNARAADPVGGCYRIILDLQRQIDLLSIELAFMYQQLAVCRAQQHQQEAEAESGGLLSTDDYANVDDHENSRQQFLQEQQYFNCLYDESSVERLNDDVKPLLDILTIGEGEGEEEEAKKMAAVVMEDVEVEVDDFFCSSKASELKDDLNTTEHIQEHDLKEAASLFTLTNCNSSAV